MSGGYYTNNWVKLKLVISQYGSGSDPSKVYLRAYAWNNSNTLMLDSGDIYHCDTTGQVQAGKAGISARSYFTSTG